MNHIDKMLDHLAKAEEANEKIDVWERWARGRVVAKKGELKPEEMLYYIDKELENKKVFRKRVNNRTYHAQMAQTYGIVALAVMQNQDRAREWIARLG